MNGVLVLSIVVGAAIVMIALERVSPGRVLPVVRGWWPRALILNGVQVGIVLIAGRAWDGWMLAHRPWSAEALGVVPGAIAGYLAITCVYYFWHRARHASPLLWRLFHQVHHSPVRIEIVTSFYKHPLEILANGVLSSAICTFVVGIGPEAAAGAVLLSGLAELVYHWNVRTPYWMGFVFQRPESHLVHHARGRHAQNYSDLPAWDMLFGTFENPREHPTACGFEPEKELRLFDMLAFQDVNAERGGRS